MLSDRVQELIEKSRIVSFDSWHHRYPIEVVEIFQQADDEKRYLSNEDIAHIVKTLPALAHSTESVKLLRDNVTEIIAQARAEVLTAFPQITQPGGELFPPPRAEACWRDFWHFLRCITYGIAGQSLDYTSDRGLAYMEQLYQELNVPLNAMILGLEKLKFYSLNQFAETQKSNLAPYFDRLVVAMKGFSGD